jgi:hypothetical protein
MYVGNSGSWPDSHGLDGHGNTTKLPLITSFSSDAQRSGFSAMADVQYYDQNEFGEEQENERLLKSDQELDGIHDGLTFPTKDERLTLRRVPDSIPWNAYCKLPIKKFLTTES